MRILTAITVILLVAGPWYLAVGLKTQGAFLSEFFGIHHFQRFSSPMDNHSGPLVYYILSILAGMFPWSIFALPTLLLVVRQLRQGTPHQCALVFVTAWIVLYVGIFSLASTKLPNYILPAYPALAIVAAYFYQHWIDHPAQRSSWVAANWHWHVARSRANRFGRPSPGRQLEMERTDTAGSG